MTLRRLVLGLLLLLLPSTAGTAAAKGGDEPVAGVTTVISVGASSAQVKASLDAKGSTTTYRFAYGAVPAFDRWTAEAELDRGKATVYGTLTGLAAGTRYHVRLVAANDDGAVAGVEATFETAAAPATGDSPATGAPATPAATPASEPAPALGKAVVAAPTRGEVKVREPGASGFTKLSAGTQIPVGSRIDARAGAVALTSAIDADGATQTGRFGGGLFVVRQSAGGGGVTDIHLRGGSFRGCRRAGDGSTLARTSSKHKRHVRRLWGSDDHGRFRTHGRDSVATVRGTRWVTVDRCGGTLTRVTEGAVDVRDRRRGRTVTVRAGHSYLARHRR